MDSEEVLIGLLWTLPWVLFVVVTRLRLREPPVLGPPNPERERPHVTVIVPARNEARNIETCVSTVLASDYPSFDVIVVDDRSSDDTAELARRTAVGVADGALRLTVIAGEPLPEGWFGKPWACHQAAKHARGPLLLFTDADTVHGPTLLSRAVAGLEDANAHALTLVSRQLMESFWERVVQPHVFFMIGWRFGNLARLYDPALEGPERWRQAIANGQFILIRRDAYEAVGGHHALRGEVVEDLRLAQEVVKSGRRLAMRDAQDVFATRMYRSFADIAEGWTKNLWTGATQAFGSLAAGILTAGAALSILAFWVVPASVLVLWAAGTASNAAAALSAPWGVWSAATVLISTVFWCSVMARFKAPARYGLTFPLGALIVAGILVRSGLRGSRIEWKGRQYTSGTAQS